MFARTHHFVAIVALAAGIAGATAIHAETAITKRQYLTFTKPVLLPGVTLNAGTYIFEVPESDASPDIVRVTSRDGRIIYLTAFTNQVPRPANVPETRLVSLKETAPGAPIPIAVWWTDATMGHEFVYTR